AASIDLPERRSEMFRTLANVRPDSKDPSAIFEGPDHKNSQSAAMLALSRGDTAAYNVLQEMGVTLNRDQQVQAIASAARNSNHDTARQTLEFMRDNGFDFDQKD